MACENSQENSIADLIDNHDTEAVNITRNKGNLGRRLTKSEVPPNLHDAKEPKGGKVSNLQRQVKTNHLQFTPALSSMRCKGKENMDP